MTGYKPKRIFCRHCFSKVEHNRLKHLWEKHKKVGTIRDHFVNDLRSLTPQPNPFPETNPITEPQPEVQK